MFVYMEAQIHVTRDIGLKSVANSIIDAKLLPKETLTLHTDADKVVFLVLWVSLSSLRIPRGSENAIMSALG